MKKIDFPLVADVLFYSVTAFVLSLGILRYYRLPYAIAATVAALLCLAAGGIAFLVIYSRHRKKAYTKKEREKRDALLLHFALEKPERVRAALIAAYAAEEKEAHCEGEAVRADGELLIPRFTMQPLSADAVARIICEYGGAPFTVVCNALSPEAGKLLSSFGLKAIEGDEVFALFERTDCTPSPLICGEIPRRTAKQKLRRTFSKKNARPFFTGGLLLMIMSLFTFFPVYYVVTGSILLICAVTVRIFGYSS